METAPDEEKARSLIKQPSSNDPPEKVDLIHHEGDRVCNVEMIPTRQRKVHNVMTRMRDEKLCGPLRVLQRCMNEDIKVKVLTRNYKHVRGICTGYILAFDKHWNVVLKDVDEVYKNPVPKRTSKTKKRQRANTEKSLHSEDASCGDNQAGSLKHKGKLSGSTMVPNVAVDLIGFKDSSSDENVEDKEQMSFFTKSNESRMHPSATLPAKNKVRSLDDKSIIQDRDKHRQERKSSDPNYSKRNRNLLRHERSDNSMRHLSQVARRDRTDIQSGVPEKVALNIDSQSEAAYQPWLIRHVNQLFIRGDNVVLVSILEN